MEISSVMIKLWDWTPFLAGGFLWNVIIAIGSMLIGTLLGSGLAYMRVSSHSARVRVASSITGLARATPTIVCQFYLIFILPGEIILPGSLGVVAFPAWIKAALALALAVCGYVSDNLSVALAQAARGDRSGFTMLVPGWTNYFMVIVMASTTASIIGVDEMLSRCNTMINAAHDTSLMLWAYLYTMLWFFAFCWCANQAIEWMTQRLKMQKAQA